MNVVNLQRVLRAITLAHYTKTTVKINACLSSAAPFRRRQIPIIELTMGLPGGFTHAAQPAQSHADRRPLPSTHDST